MQLRFFKVKTLLNNAFNPNQAGLFLAVLWGGGGGGGVDCEISTVDRAITMKIGTYVTCGVIYQTIKKKKLKFAFLILY